MDGAQAGAISLPRLLAPPVCSALACHQAEAWLKRARDRGLALPICLELVSSSWLDEHDLAPLPEQPPLVEQLWLLLPEGSGNNTTGRQVVRQLRARILAATTMLDPHQNPFSFTGDAITERP